MFHRPGPGHGAHRASGPRDADPVLLLTALTCSSSDKLRSHVCTCQAAARTSREQRWGAGTSLRAAPLSWGELMASAAWMDS